MREAVKRLLNSPAFEKSIQKGLTESEAQAAEGILRHLRAESTLQHLNEFGVPMLKGTSALDIGLFLLFIEVMGDESKNQYLAEIFGVRVLSCKNWISRLRDECMCQVVWERPQVAVRGNRGKFEVYNWGIFNKAVYSAFTPYAKMVVDNWKRTHNIGHSGS